MCRRRAVWRKRQAWLLADPEQVGKIVLIDETGINTKMARLRGRCPAAPIILSKGRTAIAGSSPDHPPRRQ